MLSLVGLTSLSGHLGGRAEADLGLGLPFGDHCSLDSVVGFIQSLLTLISLVGNWEAILFYYEEETIFLLNSFFIAKGKKYD